MCVDDAAHDEEVDGEAIEEVDDVVQLDDICYRIGCDFDRLEGPQAHEHDEEDDGGTS